jgi:hypothetical protein
MRLIRLMGAAIIAALIVLGSVGSARAQATETFTLQPGGRATITFEAFCTDFGLAFPASVQVPNALGEPAVRGAMAYIEQQGYAANEQNALEAQYGLWRAVGATNSPQGGQVASDVANAASSAPQDPQGTSLLQAAQAGQVRVTVTSWQPVGQPVAIGAATDNFYGRGTLTVENTSSQALTLYHPVGALYPPATQGEQTMAGYATDIQVENPQPAQSSTNQPNQLPNTAEGDSELWLPGLALASILLCATGWATRRRAGQDEAVYQEGPR